MKFETKNLLKVGVFHIGFKKKTKKSIIIQANRVLPFKKALKVDATIKHLKS